MPENKKPENNQTLKTVGLWAAAGIGLLVVFNQVSDRAYDSEYPEVTYTDFTKNAREGHVSSVIIQEQNVLGVSKGGKKFRSTVPLNDPGLYDDLIKGDVQVKVKPPEKPSFMGSLMVSMIPTLLLIGALVFIMRAQMGAGGRGPGGGMSVGKSRAKLLDGEQTKVRFDDVAGIDEAKAELMEMVDFLKTPEKYTRLGGKIPKGALLVGAPGTGKTLTAKAVAGEAKVPFFSVSGSEFVEMFVGVGASRVRDMFENAKKHAPCVIFIDEIDAVGGARGSGGANGGHNEREQTLNQLLVEMDGVEGNKGVIVIAATNRPDALDPALLRPGRFDRQVVVPLPDVKGREQILKVHMRKVPLSQDVDPKVIARGTPGFSGADLANIVNEAALFAARENKRLVEMVDFEHAKDKIMMGAERKSVIMPPEELRNTAYHEAGHAIVGLHTKGCDYVHKVSIIPRGRALGVTMSLPDEDRYSQSFQYLTAQMDMLYAGRIAEERLNGKEFVTTGASNDIERVTEIASKMVEQWGLGENTPPLKFVKGQGGYLGESYQRSAMSGQTSQRIDEEIQRLASESYQRADKLMEERWAEVVAVAELLLEKETISDVDMYQALGHLGQFQLKGRNGKPLLPPSVD